MSNENTELVWHKNTGVQPTGTFGKCVVVRYWSGTECLRWADRTDWELLGSFSDIIEWRLA